jgi:hypothetical protein
MELSGNFWRSCDIKGMNDVKNAGEGLRRLSERTDYD